MSIKQICFTPVLYPVTAGYISAMGVIMLIAAGWVDAAVGIIILGFVTVFIILGFTLREITVVHDLVNSQHQESLDRVDQLIAELVAHGVAIPPDPAETPVTAAMEGNNNNHDHRHPSPR